MATPCTIKDIETFKAGVEVGASLYAYILKEMNSYYYAGKKYGWLRYPDR